MTDDEKSKPGCLKNTLVSIGCCCIYPAAFSLIVVVATWFYLADPIQQIVKSPELPQIVYPIQENFWSLQEKRLDNKENDSAAAIELSLAEFNAYLSRLEFAPSNGLYISRTRFVVDNQKGIFILYCSGMFLRNLILRIEISIKSPENELQTGEIYVNSYLAARGSILNRYIKDLLRQLIVENKPEVMKNLEKFPKSFNFSDNKVFVAPLLMQ